MDFKQNHLLEIGNVTKAATFKSYKNMDINTFFMTVLFNCFYETNILTNDFWGLHKNKNF